MERNNQKHKFTYNDDIQNSNSKFVFINNEYENDEVNTNVIENTNEKEQHQEVYIGYYQRILILVVMFIITLVLSICFVLLSFSINEEKVVKYKETSEIDYKVYLKENSFYEDTYLEKDMSYISTLIETINTTFNYNFSIDQKNDVTFKYNIIGKLIIMDSTGDNVFFEKQYLLLEDKELTIIDSNRCLINENININYGYYNNIANDFRNKFGISTTSDFVVTMNIVGETKDNKVNLGKGQAMSLTIPLSQREVKIKLSTNTQNINESVVEDSFIKIENYFFLLVAIVIFIVSITLLVKLLKKVIIINNTKSKYDKYIERILKEYDRFIANTKIGPIVNDGDKVIKLNDFQELLDVRDSLKVPINYYNIVSHHKCIFYLNKDNLIYQYCVKAVDLENENIK